MKFNLKISSRTLLNSFLITSSMLYVISLTNIILEQIKKPDYKISNTLVPMSVIAFYISCVIHLNLYYFFGKDLTDKQLIKRINIFLTSSGLLVVLSALGIGGIKYKFKMCAKVYGVAFFIWLTILSSAYVYYIKSKNSIEAK